MSNDLALWPPRRPEMVGMSWDQGKLGIHFFYSTGQMNPLPFMRLDLTTNTSDDQYTIDTVPNVEQPGPEANPPDGVSSV